MAVDVTQLLCADFSLVGDKAAFDASITYQEYAVCPGLAYVFVPMDKWAEIKSALQSGSSTDPSAVAFTAAEIQALKFQAANPSPFNLSIEGGTLVGVAISSLWALAWGLKALRKSLNTDGNEGV